MGWAYFYTPNCPTGQVQPDEVTFLTYDPEYDDLNPTKVVKTFLSASNQPISEISWKRFSLLTGGSHLVCRIGVGLTTMDQGGEE